MKTKLARMSEELTALKPSNAEAAVLLNMSAPPTSQSKEEKKTEDKVQLQRHSQRRRTLYFDCPSHECAPLPFAAYTPSSVCALMGVGVCVNVTWTVVGSRNRHELHRHSTRASRRSWCIFWIDL
jgi:hypothetical protein